MLGSQKNCDLYCFREYKLLGNSDLLGRSNASLGSLPVPSLSVHDLAELNEFNDVELSKEIE